MTYIQMIPCYFTSWGHLIQTVKEQILEALGKISHHLERAMSGEIRFFYLDETVATILFFRHSAEREWSTLCCRWARKGTRPDIPMADMVVYMYFQQQTH